MRIDQLRAFVAVADEGGFTNAAAALYSTQPTLTKQVSALEKELGFALIERTTRKVALTPEGEVLLESARAALLALDGGLARARALRMRKAGSLLVGCMYLRYHQLVPGIINDYCAASGDRVELDLEGGDPESLIGAVVSGALDCAFVSVTEEESIPEALERLLVLEVRERVLVSRQHRLASRLSVSFDDLRDETVIYSQKQPPTLTSPFMRECGERGVRPSVRLSDSDETADQMVRMDLGVAMRPDVAESEAADLVSIPYDSQLTIKDFLIWRKGPASGALSRFLDLRGVKISDTKSSGDYAAFLTSSRTTPNLAKNSSMSSAGFLQPTLECGRILL